MIQDEVLIQIMAEACMEEKADDLVILDVSKMTSLTEYFLIVSGRSIKHVKSICDSLLITLGEQDIKPLRQEGYQESVWIIMDYNSVIVHIFTSEKRSHYNLERLWGGASKIDVSARSTGR